MRYVFQNLRKDHFKRGSPVIVSDEMNLVCNEKRDRIDPCCAMSYHRVESLIGKNDYITSPKRLAARVVLSRLNNHLDLSLIRERALKRAEYFFELLIFLGG